MHMNNKQNLEKNINLHLRIHKANFHEKGKIHKWKEQLIEY